ncbi:MAG: VOC family protein [Siculibacillus sp.]|nr:VOC family protein [Siculibacillus sp.]
MKPRLSLVTLGVVDIARARGFYEALGLLPGSMSNDHVVFYDMDGIILALYGRGALAADAGVGAAGGGFAGITLAWNLESEAAVDAAFAAALAAGGRAVKRPEKVFWGGWSGYVADPDGHLWEIAHNPFFPLDERGITRLPETVP